MEEEKKQELKETTRIIWRSCCLECDRSVVQFVTKTAFAGVILGFACTMIASDDNPSDSPLLSWYTSMIGLVAGSYIEQAANMTRKEDQ